jgi:hypothetical protein
MATAAQQDWSYYKTRERESDAAWLRSLSIGERFELYEDMYGVLWAARSGMPGNWARLEQRQWAEKVAVRQRMVEAFSKRDQLQRERAAAHHAL